MKLPPFSHIVIAAAFVSGSASMTHAQAVVAVQLTGTTWASTDGNLGNNGSVMTGDNIQPGSGYNGAALLGGAIATNANIGSWQVLNNGGSNSLAGNDVFRLSVANTVNGDPTKFHHAVLFFDQSTFSNDLDASVGGVTLNSTTTFSYTAKRISGNPSRFGYVIESDGAYFLHQIAYNDNQAGTGAGHVFTLSDPTAVSWSSFDPTVSLSSIGSTAMPDFTKVTGIGLWFENERASNSGTGMSFTVGEITFNAVSAIPEPSAFAAVAGLGVLGLAAMRRRRRG